MFLLVNAHFDEPQGHFFGQVSIDEMVTCRCFNRSDIQHARSDTHFESGVRSFLSSIQRP
jgi:hypothetical protein